MRRIVFLPIQLIKDADNEYWLRSLAYFVRLKSLYKNNTHYGFTLRSLAQRVGCSPATLSFHLKVLKEKGLLRFHGDNITFLGIKPLQRLFRGVKSLGVPVNHKNQHDILRGQIIRFNLSAQEYHIRKSGLHNMYVKEVPCTFHEKTKSCYTGLSAIGVGKLFGLTKASGQRIRKKLNVLGQIQCKRVFSVLFSEVEYSVYKKLMWLGEIPIYSKYKEGDILIQRRMRIKYIGNRLGAVS